MSLRNLICPHRTCRNIQFFKSLFREVEFTYRDIKCVSTDKKLSETLKSVKNIPDEQKEKAFLSRLKQNGYICIIDPVSAESIASHISHNWKEGYIFETNPGLGILTKAILNTGVPQLRVFEKNLEFLPLLEELSSEHNNLEIIHEDLLSLPSLEARLLSNPSNELDTFFNGIPEFSWDEGVPLRVFSVISSKKSIKFLRFLLVILPGRTSIFSYGRCEFFVLLTEKEYMYLKAEPKVNYSKYRWSTVLYNLFFEIQYLDKFETELFFPVSTRNKKKFEESPFYLVKLTPKSDLFTSVVNHNKLVDFYFFVRHHLAKRSNLVIPTLEGWIPFCGPRLIKEGMNVFTKFGDLSPKQILLLFNQFSSWPEYKDSAFHSALQEFYGKSVVSCEDDEDR